MLEYIAEQIRAQAFASLSWISRPAGLVEMLQVRNGNNFTKFPAAKPYYGVVCEPGDYLNMSPDGKEACIAFVDSAGDLKIEQRTSHFERFSAYFRVVVWYDEKRITVGGVMSKTAAMAFEIQNEVKQVNFDAPKLSGCKVLSEGITENPANIWGSYGFKPDDQLFMLPYRTFAVSFRLRGFLFGKCEDFSVQAQEVC